MATTSTAEHATEALILEQALADARQLSHTATEAPDGQILRLAEAFVRDRGRDWLRKSLEIALQAPADAVEKRGRRAAPAIAATTRASRTTNS